MLFFEYNQISKSILPLQDLNVQCCLVLAPSKPIKIYPLVMNDLICSMRPKLDRSCVRGKVLDEGASRSRM